MVAVVLPSSLGLKINKKRKYGEEKEKNCPNCLLNELLAKKEQTATPAVSKHILPQVSRGNLASIHSSGHLIDTLFPNVEKKTEGRGTVAVWLCQVCSGVSGVNVGWLVGWLAVFGWAVNSSRDVAVTGLEIAPA